MGCIVVKFAQVKPTFWISRPSIYGVRRPDERIRTLLFMVRKWMIQQSPISRKGPNGVGD